jgi:predicted ATPase
LAFYATTAGPFHDFPSKRSAAAPRLLDTARAYVVERLIDCGEADKTAQRHAIYRAERQLASRGLSATNIQLATGPDKKLAVIQNKPLAPGEIFGSSSNALQDAGEVFSIAACKTISVPNVGPTLGLPVE